MYNTHYALCEGAVASSPVRFYVGAIAPCWKYSNINECKHIDYINVHLVQQIAITYRCIC